MKKTIHFSVFILIIVCVAIVSGCGRKSEPAAENNLTPALSSEEREQAPLPPLQKGVIETATSSSEVAETATSTAGSALGGEETDTSDWKTYRNEEYGFELKYPKEWYLMLKKNSISIQNTKDELIIGGIKPEDDDMIGKTLEGAEFKVDVFKNKLGLSIENWVKTQPNIPTLAYTDIIINTIEAKSVEPTDGILYGDPNIFIKNKNYIYNIKFLTTDDYQQIVNEKIFEKIIESLKLFDEKKDMSDWNIFNNEHYKYNFKYPKDWECKVDNQQNPYGRILSCVQNNTFGKNNYSPGSIYINIVDNSSSSDPFTYLKEAQGDSILGTKIPDKLNYRIAGVDAVRLSYQESDLMKEKFWEGITIVFVKNNKLFHIYIHVDEDGEQKENIENILNSLQVE